MSAEPRQIVLTRTCAAPAECVYDELSDLRSHLVWGQGNGASFAFSKSTVQQTS